MNRKQVSGRVEDPTVQWVYVVLAEDEVKKLESSTEKVRRLDLDLVRWHLVNPFDARIATGRAAMSLNGLCQVPGCVTVLGAVGQPPHDEVGFRHFVTVVEMVQNRKQEIGRAHV